MLARIVGIVLALGLGGLSYAILHPRGLGGRIPPIPLGAFQSQSQMLAAAAAVLGLEIFIAALMPKGPSSPGGGGGRRKRDGAPVTVDFTAGMTFEHATNGATQMRADGPFCELPPATLDQQVAARALAEAMAVSSPQQPGAPPGHPAVAPEFAQVRQELHAQAQSESWPQAAATLRRLSSLAADDQQRLLAAQDAGDFARAQGQAEDAAEAYAEALTYARQGRDAEAIAACLINSGDMAHEAHRLDDATQAYEEACALRRRLVEIAPWDAAGRRALSLSLERLADVREDRGHRTRALDLYRESLGIAESLAVVDRARYGQDLEITRRRLTELEAKILA